MTRKSEKSLLPTQSEQLIALLKARFEKHMERHRGIKWAELESRLMKNSEKLWSLYQMEETGGEPDVVAYDQKTGEYMFYDCSGESPKGRRSVCYDDEALMSRKEHKPNDSAMSMAAALGV